MVPAGELPLGEAAQVEFLKVTAGQCVTGNWEKPEDKREVLFIQREGPRNMDALQFEVFLKVAVRF